jgi:hypothetical protein
MTTVPNNSAGRAAVFTVDAGETHRIFIVNQGHSTINLLNSSFTDSKTHLITTADANQFGNIKVTGIGTQPNAWSTTANRPGSYASGDNVNRHDNVSQLSMWGVVYQSSNGAGFALEFIGDMHDSSSAGTSEWLHETINNGSYADQTGGFIGATKRGVNVGRGIN